jgi:hypothetical protein
MTLEDAIMLIRRCAERMDSLYGKTVFDEWAVIEIRDQKARLLGYIGPRRADFQKNFASDMADLRAVYRERSHGVGDFGFSRHGVGTKAEGFMVLGADIVLICNNTASSMDEIAKNPLWLGAQVPFVELGEKFCSDPLTT